MVCNGETETLRDAHGIIDGKDSYIDGGLGDIVCTYTLYFLVQTNGRTHLRLVSVHSFACGAVAAVQPTKI